MNWDTLTEEVEDLLLDDGHGIECSAPRGRPIDYLAEAIVSLVRSHTEHDFLEV